MTYKTGFTMACKTCGQVESAMEQVQMILGYQDDAIETLLSQLEQLEVSEDVMSQANHLASVSSWANTTFMGLCSGKCTSTECTNTQQSICQFCFTKTGKQFYHAETACNRKKKFSKKVKCQDKSNRKSTSNRVYCEFCFDKTGKQFSHALTDCLRKKKFSKNF